MTGWNKLTLWEDRRADDTARLNARVPTSGKVEFQGGNNVALEVYRAFCNAYYDLFNNGGGNWDIRGKGYIQAATLYGFKVMGVRQLSTAISTREFHFCEELERLGDAVIDGALKEQFGK